MAQPRTNSNLETVELRFEPDGLNVLKNRMADLYMITDVARMRVTPDYILVYAAPKSFHTFKSARIELAGVATVTKGEVPERGLDFIFLKTRNFVQCIPHFDSDSPRYLTLRSNKGAASAHELELRDDQLKLKFIGGDQTEIKSLSYEQIQQKMDKSLSDFSFNITGPLLTKVKRLAQKQDAETVTVTAADGEVRIGQPRWSLLIDQTSDEVHFNFNKKYLSTIEVTDTIEVHVFDAFLLVDQNDTKLMIGRELDEL
jgi:hypothetical protein